MFVFSSKFLCQDLAVLLYQEILDSCIGMSTMKSCVPEFNKLAFCSSLLNAVNQSIKLMLIL